MSNTCVVFNLMLSEHGLVGYLIGWLSEILTATLLISWLIFIIVLFKKIDKKKP